MPKVIGTLAGLPGIIEIDAFYPEKEARVVNDPALIGMKNIATGKKAGLNLNASISHPIQRGRI